MFVVIVVLLCSSDLFVFVLYVLLLLVFLRVAVLVVCVVLVGFVVCVSCFCCVVTVLSCGVAALLHCCGLCLIDGVVVVVVCFVAVALCVLAFNAKSRAVDGVSECVRSKPLCLCSFSVVDLHFVV